MSKDSPDAGKITQLQVRERFKLYRWITVGVFAVLLTLSMAVPLVAAEGIVSLIAGKTTNFSIGVNIAIAFTFAATVTVAGVGGYKFNKQSGELKRLRARDAERARTVRRSGSKSGRGR
jgi:nitrate reductase NapE component